MSTVKTLLLGAVRGTVLGAALGAAIPSLASAAPGDRTKGMALMFAYIGGTTGDVADGSGTTGTIHAGTGAYEVFFDRDVSHCAYAVTPTSSAIVTAHNLNGNVKGVGIETTKPDGTNTPVNMSFHLIVFCAK